MPTATPSGQDCVIIIVSKVGKQRHRAVTHVLNFSAHLSKLMPLLPGGGVTVVTLSSPTAHPDSRTRWREAVGVPCQ